VLEPIGLVSLQEIKTHHMNHRSTDICIYIAAKYQAKEYGSKAIEWIVEWCFKMAGLHRTGIYAFSFNVRACKLYERLEFILERRNRETTWFIGAWHDSVSLGMLKSEWRAKMELKKLGNDRGSISVDGWSDSDLSVTE
jgi:RimJ/RimL family protein N-acetyltransferase